MGDLEIEFGCAGCGEAPTLFEGLDASEEENV